MITIDDKTLYEKLGGAPAIDVAVEDFYKRVLVDPLVKDFFKNTNMNFQKRHQRNFLTFVTGGPKVYDGRTLRESHKNMGLKDEHFDKIKELLTATLRDLGVAYDLITQLMSIVETTRDDILNK